MLRKIESEIQTEIEKFESVINSGDQPNDEYKLGIHIGGLKVALEIVRRHLTTVEGDGQKRCVCGTGRGAVFCEVHNCFTGGFGFLPTP